MEQFKTLEKRQFFDEIYREVNLGVAFATEGAEGTIMQHDFTTCMNFLNSYLTATHLHMDLGELYKFDCPGKTHPVQTHRLCLLLHLPEGSESTFKDQFKILNQFERRAGISTSIWEPIVADNLRDGVYIKIIGNKKWLKNAMTLSIYTHILRCICIDVGHEFYSFKSLSRVISNGGYGSASTYCKRHIDNWVDLARLFRNHTKVWAGPKLGGKKRFWGNMDVSETPSLYDLHYQTDVHTFLRLLKLVQDGWHSVRGELGATWAENWYSIETKGTE